MVKAKLREPVDADFRIVGKRVRVVRSKPGTTLDVAEGPGAPSSPRARPGTRASPPSGSRRSRADLTTREAKALGIREEVSSFTTDMGESSANRIHNVHLLGDYLDGTIVKPGQTFSYNATSARERSSAASARAR